MSTRSAPTPVASDVERGPSRGGIPTAGTVLSGHVALLVASHDAESVAVRLDAGAVAGAWTGALVGGSAEAAPCEGGYRWGWRDKVETGGVEVRRLGIVDMAGAAVGDVPHAAAQVLPLLRVGAPLLDVGAMLSELLGFVSALSDLDMVRSVDDTEAPCPPSFLDKENAVGWALQVYAPDLGEQDAGLAVDEVWADALDFGSVDDETGSGVWSCSE